jgi:signal transduction histidine kinase
LLGHWIDVTTRELPEFTAAAADSEEFARLIASADAAARTKLQASLEASSLEALWIVRPDGTARVAVVARGVKDFAAPPLAGEALGRVIAETPNPRFFVPQEAGLAEVCVRRLRESQDRLLVARRWDDARLDALARLTEGRVSLTDADDAAGPPGKPTQIVLLRPLADAQGRALRTLRVEYEAPEIAQLGEADNRQAAIFIAYGLLLIVAVGLALRGWVLHPLRRITRSLAQNDPQPVAALSAEKSELGEVARLVQTAFEQRAALQREFEERTRAHATLERAEAALRRNIEERARLGRDLHDGVIQSLYAAGMGLAGIRDLLRPDQSEAGVRLEQTRAALNETIHDVRNFIIGLEPEALKLQTFSQAVAALLETLHGVRRFRSTVRIDEELAARLTLAQRVHALQITRESVSNALRHGNAGQVAVNLRRAGEFAEYEIADDGQGFDPDAAPSAGGLRNLAQRAHELNAQLSVESKPGQGTRVRLVFSLHLYA